MKTKCKKNNEYQLTPHSRKKLTRDSQTLTFGVMIHQWTQEWLRSITYDLKYKPKGDFLSVWNKKSAVELLKDGLPFL